MEPHELYDLIKNNLRISTDTRTLVSGDTYIGIRGENFDGNTFALQALEKGACFVIIDNPAYKSDDRCIMVPDTRKTLEELAKVHRGHFSIPVIAIGGSNGKTTTKELVAAVLSKKYHIHVTKGNFNNDIGVPLTLLAMKQDSEIAVIEIGANHPGEHRMLLDIVAPTHVLVTNNGADHLEGFGSLQGVRAANKEIYDWTEAYGAVALVNKEIPDLVEDSAGVDRILYPTKKHLSGSSLTAGVRYGDTQFTTALFGSYNEPNILAAIAVGEQFEVPLEDIRAAVANYTPTLKRSQIIERADYTLVLDCYNANPSSMELALRDFMQATHPGERILLIGDMFEMGDEEARVHKEVLEIVGALTDKNDVVMVVGPRFGIYKDDYPFSFFETTEAARKAFNALDLPRKYIFVKASRGIKLEDVIKEKVPFD